MIGKTHIEDLFKQVEEYSKTTLELYKYTAISKASDIVSFFATFIIILVMTFCSVIFASIALAYWMGSFMSKTYYGFIIVALLLVISSFLFYIFRKRFIKKPIRNLFIRLLQEH